MLTIAASDVSGVFTLLGELCGALDTSQTDVAAGTGVFVSGGGSTEHLPTSSAAGVGEYCWVAEENSKLKSNLESLKLTLKSDANTGCFF